MPRRWLQLALAVMVMGCAEDDAEPEPEPVGFFVTSIGNDRGGDLGGLLGADERCASLAEAADLPPRRWRAYLSVAGPVHARDRIGDGPWRNVAGDIVAADVDELHERGIDSVHMLDELGNPAAKSDAPGREHDILTGSDDQGMLWAADRTCNNWTSSSPDDRTRVGHHDWGALPNGEWIQSWTSVHGAPCDPDGMRSQFGTGRIYCFAL